MGKRTGKPNGRPSKFSRDIAKVVLEMTKRGDSEAMIASIIGVDVRTLQRWLSSKEDFRRAIKEGREVADELVEMSLYRLANGYTTTETKVFMHKGEIVKETVLKHYPPDQRAIAFWLKNRKPKDWKDKVEADVTSSDGTIQINYIEK